MSEQNCGICGKHLNIHIGAELLEYLNRKAAAPSPAISEPLTKERADEWFRTRYGVSPAISEEEVARQATDSIAMRTADWFTGDSANRKDAIFALVKQDVEAAIRKVSGPLREQLELYRESSPNDLRELGWLVAVHNDYRINGIEYTFWLLTKGNECIKGEGRTDADALNWIRLALQPGQKGS